MLAQTSRGAITGTVLDNSGAAVPGASVEAKEPHTGSTYTTQSTDTGNYGFPELPPGSYDLTFAKSGFKTTTLTGVAVQVGTTTARDATLELGEVQQTVNVSAEAPTVESQSSDVGTVVTTQQVRDLPLIEGGVGALRSPENFVFLVPGTVGPGTGSGSGGVFESKITGGQNYGTEILLDGADTERSENGSSFDEAAPSVEAIQEFKVETSTPPAQYGRTTGGIEIFNLKSGTNQIHGDAYDLMRRTALDANNWFNNAVGAPRPPDQKHDFGGTVGGPVYLPKVYNGRDKTFFFFAFEQLRQSTGGTALDTLPTEAFRGGDFSSILGPPLNSILNPCTGQPVLENQIFDPKTTTTVNGVECRQPFRNNMIDPSRFSTVAKNVLPYFPLPQNGNQVNNFVFTSSFTLTNTVESIKVDHNLSVKNHLSGSYSHRVNNRLTGPPDLPQPITDCCQKQIFGTNYIRVNEDYTLKPTLLNHLNLAFNRTNSLNVGVAALSGTNYDQKLGITGVPGNPVLFPLFNFGDSGVHRIGFDVDNDTIDNGVRVNDAVTWARGGHTVTVGGNLGHQQYTPGTSNNNAGTFNSDRRETAALPTVTSTTGNAFASFLLGSLDFAGLSYHPNQLRFDTQWGALFAQDDYKVRPNLTLNLGLQWSWEGLRNEVKDRISGFDPHLANPGAGGGPGALAFLGSGPGRDGRRNFASPYRRDYAPRVGFAWSPSVLGLDPSKTVVRGGYGIYYGPLIYADFGGRLQDGFAANPGFLSNGFDPAFNIDSGLPSFPLPPFVDPTLDNYNNIEFLDPTDSRPSMTQNWDLQVQREVATDLILTVGYVGQHSTHLHSQLRDTNDLAPQHLSLGNLLTHNISSSDVQAAGISPPYAGFPSTFNVAQALRPFPQYFFINTDCCLENLGQSTYHALEMQLQRRFHSGLNLLASYTFSKTLTDADSALPVFATFAGGGSTQNPFNQRGEKSISNQDVPHNFVVSYIYELPVGKGKKFLNKGGAADRLLGGWEVSGLQRYLSGQPLNFGCAQGIPGYDNCIRFNQVPGQPVLSAAARSGNFNPFAAGTGADGNPNKSYFNKAAFQDPNPVGGPPLGTHYRFGTMARVIGVRMPAFKQEDFSLIKRTTITERLNLELRFDLLNAFNRHIWNRPDTGVTSPTFGVINNTLDAPRSGQFEAKFNF